MMYGEVSVCSMVAVGTAGCRGPSLSVWDVGRSVLYFVNVVAVLLMNFTIH